MLGYLLAPLRDTLRPHFNLSKTRLATMAIILFGLANGRTVNLSHLASQFPGKALHASNYRRLQHFFKQVQFDEAVVARFIVSLLNIKGPMILAVDRTNWKLGKADINILVLAIVTRRFKVPLICSFFDHRGNSSTAQRIDLIDRYLRIFEVSSIKALLADREFVGNEWINYLVEKTVPFVIRLREEMYIETDDEQRFQFREFFQGKHRRRGKWKGWISGMAHTSGSPLRFEGQKIKGDELVLVVTNIPAPVNALRLYRKRWGIECLFADAKTRGLNIEDTHMTDHSKLRTLLVLVAIAMTWAYRCASRVMGVRGIPKKSHGRREKSWFRIGFDTLRRWILHDPEKALHAWRKTCPKRSLLNPDRNGILE